MPNSELTHITTTSTLAANDGVFSEVTQRDVMAIVSKADGGLARALIAPVRDFVAWLGLDLSRHEDWARVVEARCAIRKLVDEKMAIKSDEKQTTNDRKSA